MAKPQTLFDKIWESHLVNVQDAGTCLIYIDRHLLTEVTIPQAFQVLRNAGRQRQPRGIVVRGDSVGVAGGG